MTIFVATVAIFMLVFTLLGIRLLLEKNGEFRRQCSSTFLEHEGGICPHCGRTDEDPCDAHKQRLRQAANRDEKSDDLPGKGD